MFFRDGLAVVLIGALSSVALGQHSDIEFGYDDLANPTTIEIEQPNVTSEGYQFFESEFGRASTADPYSTDEPGFETVNMPGEVLTFNPNDAVYLRVLNPTDPSINSLFGAGYLSFFDPATGVVSASQQITVEDETNSTSDLIVTGSSISGDGQLIEIGDTDPADPGGIHDHLEFILSGTDTGIYGMLVQVESDFGAGAADPNYAADVTSDPFWLLFNQGMEEEAFESSLGAFGVVPEPTSALLLTGFAGAILMRRRRRLA